MVQTGLFGRPEAVKQKAMVVQNITVCQFSWRCVFVHKPKDADERWTASQAVAERLLQGEYSHWQTKYGDALYFHANSIRPAWAKSKQLVTRVGGHMFYADRNI
jgi:spore germination cell wall hydrolase CwlJ-like protein